MTVSPLPLRWTAWFRWLLATFVGLIGGLVVFILIGVTAGEFIDETFPEVVFGVILGAIFGTAFGVAHRRFLRRHLPGITGWLPATILGFVLAAAIIFGLLNDESVPMRLIHGALVGLSLGISQWLVLRGKLRGQVWLWTLFSLIGWTLGELTGIILTDLAEEPLPLMATFLVGASLTGVGMVWLLQQHFRAEAV